MIVPLRVAVVDDDHSVRKALQRLLRTAQMDAEIYASAADFLVAIELRVPDCLVLDVRMPGMTGPELRRRLLVLGRRIPIVFITAHAEDFQLEPVQPGETIDILHKPFGDEALLASIRRCIQNPASDP